MGSKDTLYDVAVIGGGLSGLTLSCLLGQAGLSVVCLDQGTADLPKNKDLRTTAISYGSRQILERAGIWQNLAADPCPIENIQILDGSSSVLLNFLSSEVEDKSFGWILLNYDLRAAMLETLKSLKSVMHKPQTTITDFEVCADHVRCITDAGDVGARLVVGADGRGSFTRKWMGMPARQWSYNQRAVICTVSHSNPHNNVAVEHFWPEGPFAVLPMVDGEDGTHRSSVVFTEHGPESRSLMTFSDEEFETALAARFPERYGDIKLIEPRAAYPLGLVHAASYIGPRMALVADAAHGIHPIAGQGLNLGFRDVGELAELLMQAHKNGEDVGSQELLETYQRRRRPDNMAMVAVTDGLNRLFSNNIPPVRLMRRAGLRLVSKIGPAKRFFMKQAMGDR
ncbi:MAG: UbiH/UbiF/VisC/COQ6 family ubiquinone biosynthesis hydroxylase [Alphaproteobacteria bacterium]|nr:UbiH/UbiF/VisC/COQ6 family ubiquinone biosynthesis hydroxylase [Alphaproteobacteria bacterium]